ncbi:MAG: type II 3-dehydroquinate dehydratase [Pseudomonadota bacterium]
MRIMLINGPNLNLLGRREPGLYGDKTLAQIEADLAGEGRKLGIEVTCFQSNIEGELVNAIQKAGLEMDGAILNAGAYTHTSVALRDAAAGVPAPIVEVHLTNPAAREDFRKVSLLAGAVAGSISGFGAESYFLALLWFSRGKKD